MDDVQAALNLQADVAKILEMAEGLGWEVDGPHDLVVYIALTSAIDSEQYCIRFECSGYPDAPFSVKPVDPATKDPNVVRAWPQCEGFRPPSDLCMPVSREGYALHPDWQNDQRWRWNPHGNPLLRVLEELQVLLDNPNKYRGRAA